MSSMINTTSKATSNPKVDCAKECPCGVAAIPVPDQWLEVFVVGGFKVWHIIFIGIALVVIFVVVYCCFHRCRIPRTKQEIEADLMRSDLTNRFRDFLQEFPNEQVSFLDALKKVQEMEEKMEQEGALLAQDASNRKRLGWLKLKGGKGGAGAGGEVKEPSTTTEHANNDKLDSSAQPETTANIEVPSEMVTISNGEHCLNPQVDTSSGQTSAKEPPSKVTRGEGPSDGGGSQLGDMTSEIRVARQFKRRKQKPHLSPSRLDQSQQPNQVAGPNLVPSTPPKHALPVESEPLEPLVKLNTPKRDKDKTKQARSDGSATRKEGKLRKRAMGSELQQVVVVNEKPTKTAMTEKEKTDGTSKKVKHKSVSRSSKLKKENEEK